MTNSKRGLLLFGVLALIAGLYYSSRPYTIEFSGHNEKVWAHRVNDLEKLQSAKDNYAGLELDIVYDSIKNELDIYHPPRSSSRLYLSSYLQEISKNAFPFLWLDFKNLNAHNSQNVLLKLQTDLNQVGYPHNKILIETSDYDNLPMFTAAGFSCSYNVPEEVFMSSSEEMQLLTTELNQQPKIAISSSSINYPFLKVHFPERTKYLWMINSFLKHGFGQSRAMITDPKVKAVLVRM